MLVVYDPQIFSIAKELKETARLVCEHAEVNPEISRTLSQLIEDAILASYRMGWHEGQNNACN